MDADQLAAIRQKTRTIEELYPGGRPAKRVVIELLDHIDALQAENERLRAHILDIDAHATAFGVERDNKTGDEFITRYIISSGCLHRALGTIGHSAAPCRVHDEAALQARVTLLEGLLVKAGACATVLDDDPAAMQLMRQIDAALSRTP